MASAQMTQADRQFCAQMDIDHFVIARHAVPVPSLESDRYLGTNHCDQFISTQVFALIDELTGEPKPDPDWPTVKFSQATLDALKSWRNEMGAPWSTAVYEENLTLESKHFHSIRSGIGRLVRTPEVSDVVFGAIERRLARSTNENPSPDDVQKSVSEYASRDNQGIVPELFAWYTAPSYRRGSLPAEVEQVLELMTRGQHPGFERYLEPDPEFEEDLEEEEKPFLMRNRLPRLLQALERARQVPEPNGVATEQPIAGHDIRHFMAFLEYERAREAEN